MIWLRVRAAGGGVGRSFFFLRWASAVGGGDYENDNALDELDKDS